MTTIDPNDAYRLNREAAATSAGFSSWEDAIRSTADLAQERAGALLGVTHQTILNWRRRLGLPTSIDQSAAARHERFHADLSDSRHGTRGGYANLKCRCAPCTKASTDYLRGRRRAAKVVAA